MKESAMDKRLNRRKFLTGTIVSDKMNKTRTVQVRWGFEHPFYHKTIQKAQKFKAHDEKNETKTGDLVRIMETRRLSKDKRWIISEIVKKAEVAG
jgi:small subunit ribosomal protein S17